MTDGKHIPSHPTELTFLGTSAGAPTLRRNVTGVALRSGGHWDLFDCGEATQHQVMRTPLSLGKLRRIFISHLHGDHCFGLFGLLGSRSMNAGDTPLVIYGPYGLRKMVEVVLETSSTHLGYELTIHEVQPDGGRVIDDAEMTVDALPLTHRVPSLGWYLHERDRPGEFDVSAALAAGVPEGPSFGRLQRGEPVELANGRTVNPTDVMGPPRPGRRIVIAGDNSTPAELFAATEGADVAVHEATFTEPILAEMGTDHGHSTAARVARAAEQFGVRNLVLTHFSPRYTSANGREDGGPSTLDVDAEARQFFSGGLHLANDFDRVNIFPDGSIEVANARPR